MTAATRGGPGRGGGGRPLDGDGGEQEVGPLQQGLEAVAASLPRTRQHVVQGGGIPSLLLGPEPARDLWRTFFILAACSEAQWNLPN